MSMQTAGQMYGLLQIDFLCEILQKCKEQGLHTAVDTAGNVPWEFFEKIVTVQPASHSLAAKRLYAAYAALAVTYGRAPYVKSQKHLLTCKHDASASMICRMAELLQKIMEYTDLFLYDIKIFDTIKHKMYTGVGNERILENLQRLLARKANVFIRIPVIGGVNDTEEEMLRIQKFLEPYHVLKIELLPYHKMGNHKCEALGRTAAVFETPDKDTMERLNGIMHRN